MIDIAVSGSRAPCKGPPGGCVQRKAGQGANSDAETP